MYNLKKIVTYITTLLISTTVIVVTIGSITGIEDINITNDTFYIKLFIKSAKLAIN